MPDYTPEQITQMLAEARRLTEETRRITMCNKHIMRRAEAVLLRAIAVQEARRAAKSSLPE